MAQFVAINSLAEVNGQTILSVLSGMEHFRTYAEEFLAENGVKDIKPDAWYPQQSWLDTFRSISQKVGPLTLKHIGKKVPESAQWPPEVNTIEKALASIDVAYHMNHRVANKVLFDPVTGNMFEGIGHYMYQQISEDSGRIIASNPYPCAFDMGLIEAVAKKFKPESFMLLVEHEANSTCRKDGANECRYVIRW